MVSLFGKIGQGIEGLLVESSITVSWSFYVSLLELKGRAGTP